MGLYVKTYLYGLWADVAIEHRDRARQLWEASPSVKREPWGDNPDQSDEFLESEASAVLVCVCTAAFSIEALAAEMASLALPNVAQKWKAPIGRQPRMESRLLESLKASLDLPHDDIERLVADFRSTIEGRAKVVHYWGDLEPAIWHPIGAPAAPLHLEFGLPAAEKAVSSMLAIFAALAASAKPAMKSLVQVHERSWADWSRCG